MCGEINFPKSFMNRILNKKITYFSANDEGGVITIHFNDNTSLDIYTQTRDGEINFIFSNIINNKKILDKEY